MSESLWRRVRVPLASMPIEAARFLERPNRFLVYVRREQNGERVACHLPNPGRLTEFLEPGRRVWIASVPHREGRRTAYDVLAFQSNGTPVVVDNRVANRLVAATFERVGLPPWSSYRLERQEWRFGHSRMDFLLTARNKPSLLLEVKSCTLVVNGEARFPDAPTERGRRHLEELMRWVENGGRAGVLFVIQRPDAERFAPNDGTDASFGTAFRRAIERGVEVAAWTTEWVRCDQTVRWLRPVPVHLFPSLSSES